jgi:hypothetical protein
MGLIQHIVMFRLQDDSTEQDFETVCNGLLDLPKKIPNIIRYELGRDLLLTSGQTHPAGKNRQIVWSAAFKTVEEFAAYDQHEAHMNFLKNILLPRVQQGSRSAIQFEKSDGED